MAKTKLTPDLSQKILNLVKMGNTVTIAVDVVGISRETYYAWIKRGKKDKEAGKKTIFSDFSDEVERAPSFTFAFHVGRIYEDAKINANSSKWWLEKKHPDQFGSKQQLEISGPNGGAIEISDTRQAVLDFLRNRNGETGTP
jgi:hypothetical protein